MVNVNARQGHRYEEIFAEALANDKLAFDAIVYSLFERKTSSN